MTYPTAQHESSKSLLNAFGGIFCALVVAQIAAAGDMRKLAIGLILAVGAVSIGVAYRNILLLAADGSEARATAMP